MAPEHPGLRLAGLTLVAVCAMAESARGNVGIEDACPMPTPYSPASAGWAVVNNGSFEGGFTNFVGKQWIGWQDQEYTSRVHYVGSDRAYDGSFSQKLILPRNTVDFQEAGLYQQVHVVAGQTYTVSARVYLSFPGTGDGELLLAFVGANPYGDNGGDAGGVKWQEVSRQNQWHSINITVKAIFPVMTICLKGTRKWPIGADNASVWFDAVTISGPVPTTPPPGPDPDPVDPESLIPETTGPNLVSNPSFEGSFSNGVSSGWNKWVTTGSGRWKRSERIGKIGGAKYDCHGEAENITMRAKTVLLMAGDPIENPNNNGILGTTEAFNEVGYMDDTIVVGRPFIDPDLGTYWQEPARYGRELAEGCRILQDRWPRVDCWQGLNEPDTDINWQKTLDFEYSFTQRAHELGLKTCVLNLATGNPGKVWRMVEEADFSPSCPDLLAVADYIGHHVYGGPTDQFMVTNQNKNNPCLFALRPRLFKDMYDRRGWRFPPVIATEGSTWFGWVGTYTPDRVTQDILAMGGYMTADRWWAGYTNFVVGAMCSWPSFDIVGQYLTDGRSMAEAIGQWNYDHPADAMDGFHSQMFGAGYVHPKTSAQATPAGRFSGGVNQSVTGLSPRHMYVLMCWIKFEFRGHQPSQLGFHLGVDPTGQTTNGNATTIDWTEDQITSRRIVHETFTHAWRTFVAEAPTASIWLRAEHGVNDPSIMFYADQVEVRQAVDYLPTVPGDHDGDEDVDQEDFGHFQACYSGAGVSQTDPTCADALLDHDEDVDQDDFGLFQNCFTGPNQAGDPDCAY